jgi:hypothetical protein
MEVNKVPSEAEQVEDFEKAAHIRTRDDDASSIRSEALGDNLPKGYFYSVGFIGTIAVRRLTRLEKPFANNDI